MNAKLLPGFWELHQMRVRPENEDWKQEKVLTGTASFDPNRVVYLSRTEELCFGFAGTYKIDNHQIFVKIETSTFEHVEGTQIVRDILTLNENEFKVVGLEVETCRQIELTFRRQN